MKIQTLIPVSVLMLTSMIAATATAQTDAQKQLQAKYDVLTKLNLKLKINEMLNAFSNSITKDFIYVDRLKSESPANVVIADLKKQMSIIKKYNTNTNTIIGLKFKGKDAICTVKSTYDMIMKGTKLMRVTGFSLSEDTWVNTPKGWRMRRTMVTKEEAKLNGNPIKM
jgi:hypothetical protein